MSDYLSYQFEDTPDFVSTFDELPLWSAAFGLLLLKHLALKPGLTVLDLGSGTGFPLLELAGRLGSSCRLYGIDPWANANARARQKIANYGLRNVEIVETSAERLPFAEATVDLIVSNLGLNNFSAPEAVVQECRRVLKPGGQLAITTNLNGHWQAFYTLFETTLRELGKSSIIPALQTQQAHRGTVESVSRLFTEGGFTLHRHVRDTLEMKFLDGSAFLNHPFVKLGWLSEWRNLVPAADRPAVFAALEHRLNTHARAAGGWSLNVPMAFFEGVKS